MKKMPTLFVRDPDDRSHVLRDVTPGCEWVLRGEGVATRKIDGTCCLMKNRALFARREVKPGKHAPEGFVLAAVDHVTGKTVGWVPVTGAKEYARHLEALERWRTRQGELPPPGTYELIGPGVNGNPEGALEHVLVPHGVVIVDLAGVPLDFDGLRTFLLAQPANYEGIVWHRDPTRRDGEMVKLKRKDFA